MSYNLLRPYIFIDSVSMATNSTSNAIEIKLQDNIGVQLKWTVTPTGTFQFQISADHLEDAEGNIQVEGNWVTLPVSPPIVAAGAPDDAYVDFNQLSASYMRVVYTAVSGTGTLNGHATGKAV